MIEIRKITPKGDLSWYIKWLSSFLILAAVVCRAIALPMLDLWFSVLGTVGWFTVGMLWHDRALILLNGVLTVILIIGLMNAYLI